MSTEITRQMKLGEKLFEMRLLKEKGEMTEEEFEIEFKKLMEEIEEKTAKVLECEAILSSSAENLPGSTSTPGCCGGSNNNNNTSISCCAGNVQDHSHEEIPSMMDDIDEEDFDISAENMGERRGGVTKYSQGGW